MSTYTAGAMIMRAFAGWLSDCHGKKRMMALGVSWMLGVSILYWIARDVFSVAVIRGFHGAAFALAGTAIGAFVADNLPVSRMAEGLGYFGLTVPLANGIGPMIDLSIVNGLGCPTLFFSVSSILAVTLLSCFPVRSIKREAVPLHAPRLKLSNMLEKTAFLPSTVMFFIAVVNGAVMYFMALYADELHIANIGLFFAATALCMAVAGPLTGQRADHGGANKLVFIGASRLAGFGLGFSVPTLQALAVRSSPIDRRGAATGVAGAEKRPGGTDAGCPAGTAKKDTGRERKAALRSGKPHVAA